MSSSSSESQNSQNDSEYNFIPGNVFEASEVVDAADNICRGWQNIMKSSGKMKNKKENFPDDLKAVNLSKPGKNCVL